MTLVSLQRATVALQNVPQWDLGDGPLCISCLQCGRKPEEAVLCPAYGIVDLCGNPHRCHASLMTQAQSLEPTMSERTAYHRLPSNFQQGSMVHAHPTSWTPLPSNK